MSSPVHILRRPTSLVVLSLVVAMVATLLGLPTTRAAAATPTSKSVSAAASKPRPMPAPAKPVATPAAAATTTASYSLSKSVYTFLTSGLGLPLGGSTKLTGTASGATITLTVGKPTKLGLPTGVAMPAFGSTKIVITPSANTLTATAGAAGTAPATLSVQIKHANTSALPSSDLTARLSLTGKAIGSNVTLAGPLTDVNAAPSVSLTGTLPASVTPAAGVVTLAKGAAVTATTAHGLQLSGSATVGTGAAAAQVAVTGSITNPTSWTLIATAPTTAQSWSPFPSLTYAPKFAGSITDSAGHLTFDLTSPARCLLLAADQRVPCRKHRRVREYRAAERRPDRYLGPPVDRPRRHRAPRRGDGQDARRGGRLRRRHRNRRHRPVRQADRQPRAARHARRDVDQSRPQGTGTETSERPDLDDLRLRLDRRRRRPAGQCDPRRHRRRRARRRLQLRPGRVRIRPGRQVGEILWAAAPVASYPVVSTGKTLSLPDGLPSGSREHDHPADPPPPVPPQHGTTYTISADTQQFLNSLGLSSDPPRYRSASSDGKITLTAAAPNKLPITLPAGDQGLTFGPATLSSTPLRTRSPSLRAPPPAQGTTGTLSVTINNVSTTSLSSADLQATLSIAGLSVFGTAVDLTGSLGYADGKLAASLSGTLDNDVVVQDGDR